MRKFAALIVVAVLAGCAGQAGLVSPQDSSLPPEVRHTEAGREHFDRGRIGLALAEFRTALRYDPNSLRALNGAAACYDLLHRYDLAQSFYDRALAIDPDSAQTLNNLAYSHILRGNSGQAAEYLRRAEAGASRATARTASAIATNRSTIELAMAPGPPPADDDAERPMVQPIADPTPGNWIERHTDDVQYLVIAAGPTMGDEIRKLGIPPQLASYYPSTRDLDIPAPDPILMGSVPTAPVRGHAPEIVAPQPAPVFDAPPVVAVEPVVPRAAPVEPVASEQVASGPTALEPVAVDPGSIEAVRRLALSLPIVRETIVGGGSPALTPLALEIGLADLDDTIALTGNSVSQTEITGLDLRLPQIALVTP